MNSMERMLSMMQGKKTDRPPLCLLTSLYGSTLTKTPLDKYYRDSEIYARSQMLVHEKFKTDCLLSPFFMTIEGEAFGSKLSFFKNHPPNLREPAFTSPEKIKKIKMPDFENSKSLRFVSDSVKSLKKMSNDEVPVCALLLSPVDLPVMIMSLDHWMKCFLFHEKEAEKMLEFSSEYFLNWAKILVESGAAFLTVSSVFLNKQFMPLEIIRNRILPWFEKCLKEIDVPVILHHVGFPIGEILENLKNISGIAGYVIDPNDSFTKSRKIVGESKILSGNLDGPSLNRFNKNQIARKCKNILKKMENDRKWMFATSYADIPLETPEENIMIITETLHEHFKNSV